MFYICIIFLKRRDNIIISWHIICFVQWFLSVYVFTIGIWFSIWNMNRYIYFIDAFKQYDNYLCRNTDELSTANQDISQIVPFKQTSMDNDWTCQTTRIIRGKNRWSCVVSKNENIIICGLETSQTPLNIYFNPKKVQMRKALQVVKWNYSKSRWSDAKAGYWKMKNVWFLSAIPPKSS